MSIEKMKRELADLEKRAADLRHNIYAIERFETSTRLAAIDCDDPARLREIYPDGNYPVEG
jgi:hypothetical protein